MKKIVSLLLIFILTFIGACGQNQNPPVPAGEFDIKIAVRDRFLSYVVHDTQSDYESETTPSTAKQTEFAKLLVEECKRLGLTEIELSPHGIVTATLPANTDIDLPVIGFIAHLDTAPDYSGANVIPRLHENYDGGNIILNNGLVISPDEFPALMNYTGQTIITASGDTLLGADNKAGIAIILTAMEYFLRNPDIPRGKIRIAFTPDEEIGSGIETFDIEAFGADFAFTIDGGELGQIAFENFNAASVVFDIAGKTVHPGYAKGIMINAGLIATELVSMLPADETPAMTEGYEGYYHVVDIEGSVESAKVTVFIRSFCRDELEKRKQFSVDIAESLNDIYGADTVKWEINDQYTNMREFIPDWLIDFTKAAFYETGIEPIIVPARGGTDGSFLSTEGLPCPNIFTGGYNFHGPYEFIPLESMVKAVLVVINVIGMTGLEIVSEPIDLSTDAFNFFVEISKIPRGSGFEQQISDYLVWFGESRGFEVIQDEALNVFIRKPGTKNRENEAPVILQVHMDMVWDKNESTDFDFYNDPIILVINNDWVRAEKETTLGADNGAGMAMVMAILNATEISHPPIEALFTTVEEASMEGAMTFDITLLKGNRFINIDSEWEGTFLISSASIVFADILMPLKTIPTPHDYVSYKLMIRGLQGGHSGVEIHKGLANANIIMTQLLNELSDFDFSIASLDGGSRANAIPRESTAIINFDKNDYDAIKLKLAQLEVKLKNEYPLDVNLEILLEESEKPIEVFSDETASQIIKILLEFPNGVIAFNPDMEEFVQTSNNLGIVSTNENDILFTFAPRSSEPEELLEVLARLESLADSVNAEISIGDISAAWSYNPVSPLRDTMIDVFVEMYGKEPIIKAVHAGLECGIFASKMPEADFIAIGPDIEGSHSPDERMSLSSFNRVLAFLAEVLKQL